MGCRNSGDQRMLADAVTPTLDAAIPELKRVFGVIEQEYVVKELDLPADTTNIMHTMRSKGAGA